MFGVEDMVREQGQAETRNIVVQECVQAVKSLWYSSWQLGAAACVDDIDDIIAAIEKVKDK